MSGAAPSLVGFSTAKGDKNLQVTNEDMPKLGKIGFDPKNFRLAPNAAVKITKPGETTLVGEAGGNLKISMGKGAKARLEVEPGKFKVPMNVEIAKKFDGSLEFQAGKASLKNSNGQPYHPPNSLRGIENAMLVFTNNDGGPKFEVSEVLDAPKSSANSNAGWTGTGARMLS